MTEVIRHESEHIDALLNRFNKLMQFSGIIKSYRQQKFYVKPSDMKRFKQN